MSGEEFKIRQELEFEIENDLEEEIKEGMYCLAKKLHGLYLHRLERSQRSTNQSSDQPNNSRYSRKSIFSEVNINIKMDGGATIQMKELKKEAKTRGRKISIRAPKHVQYGRGKTTSRSTKFDWTQSLRSRSSTSSDASRIEGKRNRNRVHGNEGNGRVGNKIALLEKGWKC